MNLFLKGILLPLLFGSLVLGVIGGSVLLVSLMPAGVFPFILVAPFIWFLGYIILTEFEIPFFTKWFTNGSGNTD